MVRRPLIAILVGLVAWAIAASAHAQQPISGNYPGGAVAGMKGAMFPPEGHFLLENGTLHYNTREFVDGNGDEIQTGTSNVFANRTMFGYVTRWKILGGNYVPAIILPLANRRSLAAIASMPSVLWESTPSDRKMITLLPCLCSSSLRATKR